MTKLGRAGFLWLLTTSIAPSEAAPSTRRGLVFTPDPEYPHDNYIWLRSPSDLTWYYNYGATPSTVFRNASQAAFEFVPMLWGAPADVSDISFLTTVQNLRSGGGGTAGVNISHVLAFNEPDEPAKYGGSDIKPDVAAKVWVANMIPLRRMGLKVGLPSCTSAPGGLSWLEQFLGNCSEFIGGNCTFDFVPLHWYGNFEGLASHLGNYAAAFPGSPLWVTEYNFDHQDLSTTQSFFNISADYLDRLEYIGRYSLFGAFRSSKSNIGPNAAMLSAGGQLTDIGAWYLGGAATGVTPDSAASRLGGARSRRALCRTLTIAVIVALLSF